MQANNCDFLHPKILPANQSLNPPTNHSINILPIDRQQARVCAFYLTQAGCVKGSACSFAHPVGKSAVQAINHSVKPIKCDHFFYSNKGCNRGDDCQFSHDPMTYKQSVHQAINQSASQANNQSKAPVICAFHNKSARGCVKGDRCVFLHVKSQICDFFVSEKGCKKDKLCTFFHPVNEHDEPDVNSMRDEREPITAVDNEHTQIMTTITTDKS
jgi:hypothetical protein